MIFSPTTYLRLKNRLRKRHAVDFAQLLKQFKRLKQNQLAAWVIDNRELLEDFSSINWYFRVQLESYLTIINQTIVNASEGIEFSESEDAIFEKWNNSEFADVFLKQLNQGKSIAKASAHTLKIFEQHLLTLGKRHILKEDRLTHFYRPQLSLGEKKVGAKVTRLMEATIEFAGKQITLRTSSLKEMKSLSHRIETALKEIKKFSPDSWERFSAFTKVIIPIHIKQFVSYSHQEMPGVSMINIYDRDFVDLMDDLIHENGHHHLNYYLNLGEVIEEPIEAIYYSPWRRTPRPLRGIYHAYFTFFWAFKLFSEMAARPLDSADHNFSKEEQEKILWRAVEEYHMLNFTFNDLKWARQRGLISDIGWELVSAQRKELTKAAKKVVLWEKKLKKYKKDLSSLKKELKTATKKYTKN